jgi:hypothetical protein
MSDALGNGPFSLGGRTVTITSRSYDKLDENGKPLTMYFFKRIGAAVRTLD